MIDTIIQLRAPFTSGVFTFGPVSIPAGAVAFGYILDKALWSGALVRVAADIQVAQDGVNFSSLGGFTGEPIGGSSTVFELRPVPNPQSTTRTSKLVLTVSGGSISTIITSRSLDGTEPRVLG